jgi:hypothetical protein
MATLDARFAGFDLDTRTPATGRVKPAATGRSDHWRRGPIEGPLAGYACNLRSRPEAAFRLGREISGAQRPRVAAVWQSIQAKGRLYSGTSRYEKRKADGRMTLGVDKVDAAVAYRQRVRRVVRRHALARLKGEGFAMTVHSVPLPSDRGCGIAQS